MSSESHKQHPWSHMTQEELEKQYSCSMWSPTLPQEEVIPAYIASASEALAECRRRLPSRLNVAYSGESGELTSAGQLDVYGEDLPNDCPVLVYVHGGYWQELSKDLVGGLMGPLYNAGTLTVIIGYPLAPHVSVPTIVEEVSRGISWACQLALKRGSSGVVLSGWSAGAQLVCQTLLSLPPEERGCVRAVVLYSGVFDLRPLVATSANAALGLTWTAATAISPLLCVGELAEAVAGRVRMQLVIGQYDSPEFRRQSHEYSEKCNVLGLTCSVVEVSGADHFTLVLQLANSDVPQAKLLRDFIAAVCNRKEYTA